MNPRNRTAHVASLERYHAWSSSPWTNKHSVGNPLHVQSKDGHSLTTENSQGIKERGIFVSISTWKSVYTERPRHETMSRPNRVRYQTGMNTIRYACHLPMQSIRRDRRTTASSGKKGLRVNKVRGKSLCISNRRRLIDEKSDVIDSGRWKGPHTWPFTSPSPLFVSGVALGSFWTEIGPLISRSRFMYSLAASLVPLSSKYFMYVVIRSCITGSGR